MFYIHSSNIRIPGRNPVSFHRAYTSGENFPGVGVICICHSYPALFKEAALHLKILGEIFVLTCAYVIRRKVRKNTDLKHDSGSPVHHQGLGGYFHDRAGAARFDHLMQIFLDKCRLRSRILRRDMRIADNCLDRTYEADFVAGVLEDRADHVGGRCLSLSSGDSYDRDLIRRIFIPGCRYERHGISRVRDTDDRAGIRNLSDLFLGQSAVFHDDCSSAVARS